MITDFEGCGSVSQHEDVRRYLYELCEKLNVSFSVLESEIGRCVKYENGTARPDSVSVNGGEAEIGSHGDITCKSVKTNTLDVFNRCEAQSLAVNGLTLPNGVQTGPSGLILRELWGAERAADYVNTGGSFQVSASVEPYRFFLVRVCNEAGTGQSSSYIPCSKMGSYIRGCTGFCSANELQFFICNLTAEGDTVNVTATKVYYPLTGRFENKKITRFFAVI